MNFPNCEINTESQLKQEMIEMVNEKPCFHNAFWCACRVQKQIMLDDKG